MIVDALTSSDRLGRANEYEDDRPEFDDSRHASKSYISDAYGQVALITTVRRNRNAKHRPRIQIMFQRFYWRVIMETTLHKSTSAVRNL